jgi:hypothetical protein
MPTNFDLLNKQIDNSVEQSMKPITQANMFLPSNSFCNILWLCGLCTLAPVHLHAQTIVQGNIGGTWTPVGNPYIAVADCTVTSTLILQPGVILDIESNVTVTANGNLIQAVGTPTQRITIQGWPSSSVYNTISVENNTQTTSFMYCDFANAQTALSLVASEASSGMNNISQIMPVDVLNCTFSNCSVQAINGYAYGQSQSGESGGFYSWTTTSTLNPVIKNCVFNGTSNGCDLDIYGQSSSLLGKTYYGYGYSYPVIVNNVFKNLTRTAFLMEVGSYAGGGSSVFLNNTMVNCMGGVNATDPWDATVQSDIFVGCTNAVTVSGSLSRTISYNDFFTDATNFTGLPIAYGQVLLNNRNGTPSDVLYNIYQEPLFADGTNFYLATN